MLVKVVDICAANRAWICHKESKTKNDNGENLPQAIALVDAYSTQTWMPLAIDAYVPIGACSSSLGGGRSIFKFKSGAVRMVGDTNLGTALAFIIHTPLLRFTPRTRT